MSPTLSPSNSESVREQVAKLLAGFRFDDTLAQSEDVQAALYLARKLQDRARVLQTPAEKRQQAELDRMIQNPADKTTLMQLTDQTFRSTTAARSADQFIHILDVQGVPRFFSPIDRTLLRGFQSFGSYLPGVAMPLVKEKMQHETANVILPAEREHLREHLEARRAEGVRMNVNHLGEALLGERDARRRLENYLQVLQRPEIEVISVKISTIYSQIAPLARQHTIDVLSDRIELLFRAATRGRFVRHDGVEVSKFVYLDMEEYRDMDLTAATFRAALDRPGLEQARAGIALQAYVPDSHRVQKELHQWARQRVATGRSPITIRIVKGANMEAERVEASIKGWPQAPYKTKAETDANYLRMLQEAMKPENLDAVRLGVASHNLFSLAYGLVVAARHGAIDQVQFEMLEGMANHQRRALFELSQNLLLYAPACYRDDFTSAIGYLVRRLDENTGPDNFLRHAFNITVGSEDWHRLEEQFCGSEAQIDTVSDAPRRTQDRRQGAPTRAYENTPWQEFVGEPDTDWSLPANSEWANSIVAKWQPRHGDAACEVPLVVAGDTIEVDREVQTSTDPSRPGTVVARYRQATIADVDRAILAARIDSDGWRSRSYAERSETLHEVANELARERGDLLGAMLAEGGKLLTESDPEVSEAIDFCRFYGQTARWWSERPGLSVSGKGGDGKGVVAVVSPWNFPLAIPCGGIAAVLAAGNTVLLKPASDTVMIAYKMCECFWRAGVPKTALQFIPCPGSKGGQHLVTHPDVDAVILTGGTETAERMLAARPDMTLFAETGGKNATIVTAMADRDLAIKNVMHSAFGHGGQKCSATSLLLLEAEVFSDPKFKATLVDAVESITVGSAWELPTKMAPLIRPPTGELERSLKELEPGETWAVMPKLGLGGNRALVSPGVKWNVAPDSFTHCTEFFGPLLGVMSFKNLAEAIELVNATGFGLTSGIESLDDREIDQWKRGIRAGNLYINRGTTGAIVLRQPFGGMGKSNVGPGIKAGGPNYVAQLMAIQGVDGEAVGESITNDALGLLAKHDDIASDGALIAALTSYDRYAREEFLVEHDHFRLLGEDNFRRYLPLEQIQIRVTAGDSWFDIVARVAAARAVGCRVTVSSSPVSSLANTIETLDEMTEVWAGDIEFVTETDDELAALIREGVIERVRYATPDRVPTVVREAAAEALAYIAAAPVSGHGRLELLWYVREQSVSHQYHRYGNLGLRANEPRDEPA